jgi:hypothetical protein
VAKPEFEHELSQTQFALKPTAVIVVASQQLIVHRDQAVNLMNEVLALNAQTEMIVVHVQNEALDHLAQSVQIEVKHRANVHREPNYRQLIRPL